MPIVGPGPKPLATAAPASAAGDKKPTALQSHVAFFAQPDGTITHQSAKTALESLGYSSTVSSVVSAAILAGLSGKQHGGSFSAAKKDQFKMNTEHIAQAKHPGSTGVFDADGKLNQARFDERFNKFDTNKDGKLSSAEVSAMQSEDLKGLSVGDKIFGFIATKGEFGVLGNVLKMNGRPVDKHGDVLISKEDLTKFYTGDLFPELARDRQAATPAAPAPSKGWGR